jgi:type III pantothenate kinase
MLMCLDVGNTHILGGIFDGQQLVARFRCVTHLIGTADQFGIFLRNILQANELNPKQITASAICSVVPSCDYTIKHTISQYFGHSAFMLRGDTSMALTIKSHHPNEVGADLIAGAIGAIAAFPEQHLIIVDMGTATTVSAVSKHNEYLGVSIIPGMRLSMESLHSNTAKLMEVNLEVPSTYIGRVTRESIQSGLFYGQLGALKEIIAGIKAEAFGKEKAVVVGTGGFAQLFKETPLFDALMPDLVLQGILQAYDFTARSRS